MSIAVFVYPSKLVIRSKRDAEEFLNCIKPNGCVEIPDITDFVNGRSRAGGGFWFFERDGAGNLRYCYSHYGHTAFDAPPLVLINSFDGRLAADAVFSGRKSVNAFLHKK